MNSNRFVILFLTSCISAFVEAQPSYIDPYHVELCNNKTTHIIFPFSIKSIDRGSPDVLAQRSPGADEVLQLKADHPHIASTNVTVITSDNKLYSFLVVYDSIPQHLTLSFNSAGPTLSNPVYGTINNRGNLREDGHPDAGVLQATAIAVAGKKEQILHLHSSHDLMSAKLSAIYIQNDVYYFSLTVTNKSNVSFSLGTMSFVIGDTKKVKRKASQEKVIHPLFSYQAAEVINGHEQMSWVVALPKFTLEDKKQLHIQILEQDGGRNLSFDVRNKQLLSAQRL